MSIKIIPHAGVRQYQAGLARTHQPPQPLPVVSAGTAALVPVLDGRELAGHYEGLPAWGGV